MKFCSKPWTRWYIINAENGGEVWPCEWMSKKPVKLGTIIDNEIDELIDSEDLKRFKESILDGSFCMCDVQECEYISNDRLPDLSEEEINKIITKKYPEEFNLAYDETCNHACSSCRGDYFKGTEEYYQKVRKINEKMLPLYNQAKYLSVNGRGDIFACNNLLEMLGKLKPEREDFIFDIETNAALFNKSNWKKLEHLSQFEIRLMVTVNSFHDSTYRFLNGYANHVEQVLENLMFIKQLRREGVINDFSMSMVVQEANFRELPEYVERCLNEFEADHVRIRGIMKFCMAEDDFWYKDVFNPAHPCYKEVVDILHQPIMKDPRVWYWEGDYEQVRQPIEHPHKRFENYYNLLCKMVQLDEEGQLDKKLESLREKRIVVYGAGHIGEYLLRILQKYQYNVCFALDRTKEGNVGNCVVHNATKNLCLQDIDVVISTIPYYRSDTEMILGQSGYKGALVMLDELIVS